MPAHSVSPVSSVAEALDRWRAGERVEVLRSEFLDVLARCRTRGIRAGDGIRWMGCWRSRSWRPRRGCAATPGSRPGRPPPRRSARPAGDPVPAPEREDVPVGASRLDPVHLDRRLGAYFTALAAARPPPRAGCWRSRWTARRCAARGASARSPRTWCRCSPTAPGWCSASSPSPRRATKSPACESFSGCSGRCGCWSRWMPCTPRPRPRS